MFRPGRIIESRVSSDWLQFRAPLVTLVTCRRQVSSIYRTRKQQKKKRIKVLDCQTNEDYQNRQSIAGNLKARLRVRIGTRETMQRSGDAEL